MLAWLRIWGAPTQPVLQAICREMITITDQWNFVKFQWKTWYFVKTYWVPPQLRYNTTGT